MSSSQPGFSDTWMSRLVAQSIDATIVLSAEAKVVFWNAAATRLFGYPAEQALGRQLVHLITPDRFVDVVQQHFDLEHWPTHSGSGQTIESLARNRAGTEFWVEGSFTAATIEGQRWLLAQYRNAHDRKVQEQLLKRQATTDTLSGLCNRGQFQSVLEANLRANVCVAILDIDRFKSVNDTYGHPTGDDGIRFVAEQLRQHFQDATCVGRLGGDEFGVVLQVSDQATLIDRFETLRERIAREFRMPGNGLTVSVGLAIAQQAAPQARELWTLADQALYRAKTLGRNRVEMETLRPEER